VFNRSTRHPFLQAQENKLPLRIPHNSGEVRTGYCPNEISSYTNLPVYTPRSEGKDVPLLKHHAMKMYGAVEL